MNQIYDNYEVHPVMEVSPGVFEQVDEKDETAVIKYWSVFAHIPKGGLECIADFMHRQHANLFCYIAQTLMKDESETEEDK